MKQLHSKMKRPPYLKQQSWVLVVILCAVLGRGIQTLQVRPHIQKQDIETEIFWREWVGRLLTLNHKGFVADWVWLDFLQRSVEHSKAPESKRWEFESLKLASRLDVHFFNLYAAGGPLLIVGQDDVEGAEYLLREGARVYREIQPDLPQWRRDGGWTARAWWLFMNLGYLYLFELADIDRAAQALQPLETLETAPAYARSLSHHLKDPRARIDVGLRILDSLLLQTTDERVRVRLEKRKQKWLERRAQSS